MLYRLALLVALSAAPLAAQAPCVTATQSCERWLTWGAGPQRTKVYGTYALDKANPKLTRALIMVHGAGRNADHYFETSIAAAFLAGALDNTMVLAPRFAARTDTVSANEILWPEGGTSWRAGGVSPTLATANSFDVADQLVKILADKKRFPNLKHIVVAGHSAGGQYATRYAMASKVHDTPGVSISYVVANPSSYAWPTTDRPLPVGNGNPEGADKEALGPNGEKVNGDFQFGPFDATKAPNYNKWPAGLDELQGYVKDMSKDQLIRNLVSRPTTYLLGQVDVLPLGGFDSSANAMAQGPTRRARGEAFFKYLTDKYGAKHNAIIVSECGHNDRCVYTTNVVFPVIFPK